ncbi:MAG: prenyltransferase/squalene oxidase repeat-containing protein [Phycisphaerae bacterium]
MQRIAAILTMMFITTSAIAQSQPATRALEKADAGRERAREQAKRLLDRGAKFLVNSQDADGAWAGQSGIGISALALRALARHPDFGSKHPSVERGVEFVLKAEREEGGLYSPDGLIKNYEMSVALSMLVALDDPKHKPLIEKMQKQLVEGQWDEGEGRSIDDPWYGGTGYGNGKRPDLSNVNIMMDALRDSGLVKDSPAYKKALIFISRCQMLGEHNDQPLAKDSTDGGFIYSPANGGESKAGERTVGERTELRTYGSMTYAGFKSMIYAGLTTQDPRVQAAIGWIGANWTLEFNPSMPEKQSHEGLFYYYMTFGRALAAFGEPVIRDKSGRDRDWRTELVEQLGKMQKDDGSWVNEKDRWMEGHPALTTAYSMIALQEAFPELTRSAKKE